MKLLAAADIHLGCPPARVLPDWAEAFSPRKAFERLLDAAIQEEVDAVLLAGDVAHDEQFFYEAFGTLRQGVERLQGKGIPLVAVAGNHDTAVLPELAEAVDDPHAFRLLGRGGQWESMDLACQDGTRVRVWGWSFPEAHHRENPLTDFPGPGDDAPAWVLGLLHADRDARTGLYAPVPAIQTPGVRLWVLGHIHLPDPLAPKGTSCYAGSLQALGPDETGLHGALRITGPANAPELQRCRCGGLRYETLDLDAAAIQTRTDMVRAIRTAVERLQEEDPACEALSLRIRVRGETEIEPDKLQAWAAGEEETGEMPVSGQVSVRVERADADVRPPLDLSALGRGNDTVAALAKLLEDLDRGAPGPEAADLVAEAQDVLQEVDGATAFGPLQDGIGPRDPDEAVRLLRQQGYRLLRTLVGQREGGNG